MAVDTGSAELRHQSFAGLEFRDERLVNLVCFMMLFVAEGQRSVRIKVGELFPLRSNALAAVISPKILGLRHASLPICKVHAQAQTSK